MENMDVLVRGVVMQNQGIGLGLISLASAEWAWVAVVATIVMAFVSVRRVSIFSVGLTWRGKPGQMRVQVQSFSSSLNGNCIVTARGMFSAGLVKSSEPEAEVSSECCGGGGAALSSPSSKVAAEMFFVFEKKTTSVVVPKLSSPLRTEKTKVQRRVRRLSKLHTVAYMDPQPSEGTISVSRREGIEWDPGTSPHILSSSSSENMDFLLPSWAQTLAKPLVAYRTPILVSAESSTSFASGWDPLLKLKIRDAVCGDRKCFSSTPENFRLSPVVAKDGNNLVSLRNDVVRLWDTNAKTEVKRVYLPKRSSNANVNALTSAFDVDWDAKRAAVGGADGSLSFIDLERSAFEKSYQMQQAVVQAIQLDRNTSTKTALVGGPGIATSGCSVSLWDTRTSNRQIDASLNANLIYGLRAQGNELYVRDNLKYVSLHDVRMLKGSNVGRIPCGVNSELKLQESEDKWWDVDVAHSETNEDVDDDGEFWDCQSTTSEGKELGKPSMVGNFVLAVSRSFSSKSLGR